MLMVSNFVVLQQRFFFLWRITTSLVFCGFRGDGCGGESGGVFMWCVAGSGGPVLGMWSVVVFWIFPCTVSLASAGSVFELKLFFY